VYFAAVQVCTSEITKHPSELLDFHPDDLEPVIVDECLHLKSFLVHNNDKEKVNL